MPTKYTKELLEPIIKECFTWAEVCRTIGIKPNSGSQSHIKSVAQKFEINFTHFTGQAWSKNKSLPRKDSMDYCTENIPIGSHILKLKLIRDGYKEAKCECCGLSEWIGKEIVLELDHIDNNHFKQLF